MEQEPYVIPEERRKTQGEKYRYKEDEKYLVPAKATVYQTPEGTHDLIQLVVVLPIVVFAYLCDPATMSSSL